MNTTELVAEIRPEKKFRPGQDLNPRPLRHRCSALPTELITGSPSSSCEMIILRNNNHGGIIRVCMGIFTTAPRNEIIRQILTLLLQRIACYLTAYFDEKDEF